MNELLNIYLVSGRHFASLLPREVVFKRGLTGIAIVGSCPADESGKTDLDPNRFVENREFVDFLHGFIAREAIKCPTIQSEAKSLGAGLLGIKDLRKAGDEFGIIDVQNGGKIIPGSYRRNSQHRLFSSNGWFQLTDYLHNGVIAELVRSLPAEHRPNSLLGKIRSWLRH